MPRLCGPVSPGWHTTWRWHWHGHSNHPDLSWGSLIQALASTQHHPLNFLVSQYTATQLCCWVHTSCGSGCWMVDVSLRRMESSHLQVPQKHQQRSSGAASRPHLFPAQHSHTTNQKFSAYPGSLPLHSCQLAPANKLIKHFLTMK